MIGLLHRVFVMAARWGVLRESHPHLGLMARKHGCSMGWVPMRRACIAPIDEPIPSAIITWSLRRHRANSCHMRA